MRLVPRIPCASRKIVTSPLATVVTRPVAAPTVATLGASLPQVPPVTVCVVPLLKTRVAVNVSVCPSARKPLVELMVIDVRRRSRATAAARRDHQKQTDNAQVTGQALTHVNLEPEVQSQIHLTYALIVRGPAKTLRCHSTTVTERIGVIRQVRDAQED